ncbi:hypothetical protein OF83DRAFT_471576 [Amylostereum chailletii]|nr:hypothetical protein OF83DRAFT_471576 [Amylostereum chailletii]
MDVGTPSSSLLQNSPTSGLAKLPVYPHDIVFLVLEQLAFASTPDCASVARVASWTYRFAMPLLLRHVIIHNPREAQHFYPISLHMPNTHYPPSVIARLALVRTLAIDPRTRTTMPFEPRSLHFLPNLERVFASYMFLHVMANPSDVPPRPGLEMTICGSNVHVREAVGVMPPPVRGKPNMLSAVTHLHLPSSSLRGLSNFPKYFPLLTHLAAEYSEHIGLDVQFPTDHLTMLVFLAPVDMPFASVRRLRGKVGEARRTGQLHLYYGEWIESLRPLMHWEAALRSDVESVWERASRLTELIDVEGVTLGCDWGSHYIVGHIMAGHAATLPLFSSEICRNISLCNAVRCTLMCTLP